jgi:hypothetical protein
MISAKFKEDSAENVSMLAMQAACKAEPVRAEGDSPIFADHASGAVPAKIGTVRKAAEE